MAKKSEISVKVSKSLQQTVDANEHIEVVHFDAAGNHHFQVHEHKAVGKGANAEKNGLYARIQVTKLVDNKAGVVKEVRTPILHTKIVESLTREQILNAEAQSDLLDLNLSGLNEAERKMIAKFRKGE